MLRRLIAPFLAAAAAAGALVALTGPAAAALPGCTASQLTSWIDSPQGAAGTEYFVLHLANVSGAACTLRGYPGVSAVGAGGRQLGAAAVHSPGNTVRTITLGAAKRYTWSSATTTLGIVDSGNFSVSACQPRIATGLRVYPPGSTRALFVGYAFSACAKAPRGGPDLTVRAVR